MAQNPNPSELDAAQIIKRSFNADNDALRADVTVTAVIPGPVEVTITDVDDSIKIGAGGPGPYLNVNSDGSINVKVPDPVAVTQSGTWNINNISGTISLPTGAATSANQTTEITSLSSIDSKLTTTNSTLASIDAGIPAALGQTTMTNSMPVVIASDQSTLNVAVVSSVEIEIKNDAGNPVPVSGTVAATQSGTWNINNISGTVSLPTGAATEATLAKLPILPGTALGSNSGVLAEGSVTTAAPTYTTGNINPLSLTTSGALRTDSSGTTQPVSGTVAATQSGTWTVQQGTPPWSVVGNVASGATDSGNPVKVGGIFNTALPTITNGQRGDIQLDSSARQIIAPLTNSSIVKAQLQDNSGAAITLGQKTMANSVPVVIASDQSNLVTQLSENVSSTDVNALVISGVGSSTTATFTVGNYASASFWITFSCTNTPGHFLSTFILVLQESWDGGTTWLDTFYFPQFDSFSQGPIGTPPIRLSGTSYRFKYTKSGSNPNAATLSVRTLKFSKPGILIRSTITQDIDATTQGSYMTPLLVDGCSKHSVMVYDNGGNGVTTHLNFWISNDGTTFYDTGYGVDVNSDNTPSAFSVPVPILTKYGTWAMETANIDAQYGPIFYQAQE